MNKEIFVKLLAQRQFKAVRSILDVMNEVDIASLLSDLDDKELALALSGRDVFRKGVKRAAR